MKLDPRIIEGKKPLTAFDVMESKFIGTDCYFSDHASDYGDLTNCQIGCLLSRDGNTGVFNATKNNSYAFLFIVFLVNGFRSRKNLNGGLSKIMLSTKNF